MATRHEIEVELYPVGADADTEPLRLGGGEEGPINYVSFVAFNTYGPPPVIADQNQQMKDNIKAEIEEHGDVVVLYVNPQNIGALKVTRLA